jgi:hypothetical protein
MPSSVFSILLYSLSALVMSNQSFAIDANNLQYEVVYYLQSHECDDPRDTRGIAVDMAEQNLYLGYNNLSCGGEGPVRKVGIASQNVDASVPHRGKCITVDDANRIYVGYTGSILVYTADLLPLYVIPIPGTCEGLTVKREAGVLALYATNKSASLIYRWELVENGTLISSHTAAGLDGDGEMALPSSAVRGIAVAADGRILVAHPAGGEIFRMNSDGSDFASFPFVEPYYIAMLDNQFVVSNGYSNTLNLVDFSSMQLISIITPPWADLGIVQPVSGYGNDSVTGVIPTPAADGFYFVLEHGDMENGIGWEPVVKATALQTAEADEVVYSFNLEQNYPNPFNPVTTLSYQLQETSIVKLVVFDMLGRQKAELVNKLQTAGQHQIEFDASAFSSGSYIYTIYNNGNELSRRMILLK